MEAMLSIQEVVELMGCSRQYVNKLAKNGKLIGKKITNSDGSPKWMFPISSLDADTQRKYYDKLKTSLPAIQLPKNGESRKKLGKPLDTYSAEERDEIAFWLRLVADWQDYRKKPGASKADVDEKFVLLCKLEYPDREISVDTLYRRQRAIQGNDLDGLIDKRGKWKKGRSSIDETLWQAFLSFYLDESQHPIKKCYEYMKLWARQETPHLVADMPCYTTFYRRVQNDIPEPIKVLGREGEKAFDDRCAPYIQRVYENMASNEYWIADNHTFDVITQGENGQRHRLYLTAFMDARSGIFTGFYVTTAPSSQSTLIALRKGILKYGIPENIYVDNGREFLTFDIGGLGHRAKKPKDGQERFEPPPVFERLGIKMTNAIVRNAKAKIIERRFRDVKDQLSRLFETFTGGNVLEKPERLKHVLKNGEIPLDATFIDAVEELLDGYFNQQAYGGEVAADRGKSRIQVYNEQLHKKRVASAEDLNLLLMRSTRPQKVGRLGVRLPIAGYDIPYWDNDFIMQMQGKQVYLRYDPDDLREVRVYDLQDRFICTLPARDDAICKYGDDGEQVKAAIRETRSLKKKAREQMNASILPFVSRHTALELVMEQAHESKVARIIPETSPKVLELQRPDEEPLLQAVAGGPDLDVMNRNALRRNGGFDNE